MGPVLRARLGADFGLPAARAGALGLPAHETGEALAMWFGFP